MTTTTTTTTTNSSLPPCKILMRSKEGVEVYELPDEYDELQQQRQQPTATTQQQQQQQRPFLCRGSTSLPIIPSPDGSVVYIHMTGRGICKYRIPERMPWAGGALVDDGDNDKDKKNGSSSSSWLVLSFPDTSNVQMMDLSPGTGSFLLTWERWNETTCPHNLRVWDTARGKLVAAFVQRNIKRDSWPYLQWTHDERVAILLTTNEVRFYPVASFPNHGNDGNDDDDDDPTAVRYSDKFRIPNVSSISVPRTSSLVGNQDNANDNNNDNNNNHQPIYIFTAFVPATKDKPARAGLYRFVPGSKPDTPPILSKSLFQAEDMKVDWSPAGDAALLTLQTSVDKSGQSYYGSSQLFLMRYDGESEVVAVPLPQEGPVSSVGWLPDATKPPCFVVVAGKMPSLSTLHHGKSGQPTFTFGNAHRNVVSWSPHGRFLCLAGFGNLAGGMSFWDRNKQKLVNNNNNNNNNNNHHPDDNATGQLRAGAPVVGYDWSPSSRWFLCSTCSPRMNVDNGVRLFRYNGRTVPTTALPWNNQHYEPDKLLQACFVPAPSPHVYPDRPQSPVVVVPEGCQPEQPQPQAISAAAAATGGTKAAAPTGRYVPPSARGRPGGSSLAERLRREKEGTLQTATRLAHTTNVQTTLHGQRVVVGLAAPPPGKSKSALKREKEKKKKQQQQQGQPPPPPPEEEPVPAPVPAATAVVTTATAAAPPTMAPPASSQDNTSNSNSQPESVSDPEKRARKIKKMLKQIEDLKEKGANNNALNEDQKAKIASEEQLRAELKQLGLS
ncbi:hypothetical protein ACA910_021081 [Epithemia clementina (nom. ined.)]